jgi:hypothetical protein
METKTIVTHSNGGMAGTAFRATKYLIDQSPGGYRHGCSDFDKKEYHCFVQQLRRREKALVTMQDEWAKPKDDFDAPCEASDPFRA